ncbi:MAG: helix-turn-helix domain-containing protein [Planctomycetota bacterium]
MSALAARCGWTRHHFARRFKARTGTTPRAYILATRIAAAQDLLAASDLPVTRVAEELGYGEVYAFSKQFTAAVGVPPSTWRRERRERRL